MALRWTQEKNKSLFSKLQSLAFSPLSWNEIENKTTHFDVESQEIISRIKGNIQKLSEVNMKMEFMLEEIQSVIRKRF